MRQGEPDVCQDVEYLADALLAPLNVDLYYQCRVTGIPTERISSQLHVPVPCK